MSSEKVRQSGDGHHRAEQAAPAPLPEVDFGEFAPPTLEAWKEAAAAALKGAPFEKAMFTSTYEGITLNPLYTDEDTRDLQAARTFPGVYPLRGDFAAGNLRRPWEIAQFCDETLPADAHRGIAHELDRGASTVALTLDGRTLAGLDAEKIEDLGETGRHGRKQSGRQGGRSERGRGRGGRGAKDSKGGERSRRSADGEAKPRRKRTRKRTRGGRPVDGTAGE